MANSRVPIIGSGLILLLASSTIIMWIRSLRVQDAVYICPVVGMSAHMQSLDSQRGIVRYLSVRFPASEALFQQSDGPIATFSGPLLSRPGYDGFIGLPGVTVVRLCGFGYETGNWSPNRNKEPFKVIIIPYSGVVTLLLCIVCACGLITVTTRRRRFKPRTFFVCGYDLRSSGESYPEWVSDSGTSIGQRQTETGFSSYDLARFRRTYIILDHLLILGGIVTVIITCASEILLLYWPDIVRAQIGGEALYYLWNVSSALERDAWAISLAGVLFAFWVLIRKRVGVIGRMCAVSLIGLNVLGFVLDRLNDVQW